MSNIRSRDNPAIFHGASWHTQTIHDMPARVQDLLRAHQDPLQIFRMAALYATWIHSDQLPAVSARARRSRVRSMLRGIVEKCPVDPLSSWGAALAIRAQSCTAPELACNTGAANAPVAVSFVAMAGTPYFIFPSRFTGAIGNYTLTIINQ